MRCWQELSYKSCWISQQNKCLGEMLLTAKDSYVNKIHSIARAHHWPVVLIIILLFSMLIGTAIKHCHGYDQGGYFKSQMCGAVLYVRRKKFAAVGVLQSSMCMDGCRQTQHLHCPWLELARQCRTVPSPAYPASQQVLLVWAQHCASTAHDWWTGAGSCPASLECALAELMSDWIICVHVPVLCIVNAKAKFPFQTQKIAVS